MPSIKKLTTKYKELYKEYTEFFNRNQLIDSDIKQVVFIYYKKLYNRNCIKYNKELTPEECSMYNLTVDDDENWLLVDNEYGAIYVQLIDMRVIGFRCTGSCMKPSNYKFLNQWIVDDNNIPDEHYQLLQINNLL
jgi:hypothetical protein